MCEHRLRNRSAGTIGHGTALPEFPVGIGGVGKLHAVPARRDRTRGGVQSCEAVNPGSAPRGIFAPALAMSITGKHLTPKKTGWRKY
jgi:hypothetical protein